MARGRKVKRQRYITMFDKAGLTNMCGIIWKWHDDQNLTVEWIPAIEVDMICMTGSIVDLKAPIVPEMCQDINLQTAGEYKLHYTWFTAAGDWIRDGRRRKGR